MSKTSHNTRTSGQSKMATSPSVCASASSSVHCEVPGAEVGQRDMRILLQNQVGLFAALLKNWQATSSIEEFMNIHWNPYRMADEDFEDGLRVAELIGRLDEDPAFRAVWLHSMHTFELALIGIIADRTGRDKTAFDVKLCAATVTAAIRAFDEMMCQPDVIETNGLTLPEATKRLAQVIRNASTLSFCDPVKDPGQAN